MLVKPGLAFLLRDGRNLHVESALNIWKSQHIQAKEIGR
jgi:hypothetical protein